jgi:hypothetical protein
VSDDSAAIEENIAGDYHDLLKDSKSKTKGDKVCITRAADAILDDKDLTTDVETYYRDQDISGDVGIPISARFRSYTKSSGAIYTPPGVRPSCCHP